MQGIVRTLLVAVLVAVASAAVGLVFNAVRQSGIALVADAPYEIFVPCPEPLGEVDGLDAAAAAALAVSGKALLIDAGSAADFTGWHPDGAWNIAFDYIMPVKNSDIRRIASSRASKVVVYGDGAEPDSGHELARELAGRGIKNVVFVEGGVQALKTAMEGK